MPETARHLTLGGTQGSASGDVVDTSQAFWLSEIAEEAKAEAYPYIAVGRDGALQQLADDPDPFVIDWSVGAPLGAWPALSTEDGFALWLQPETGIQFAAPTAPYPGAALSPLDAALKLIDRAQAEFPGTPVVISQGWPDLSPFLINGTLTDATRKVYIDYAQGDYLAWFEAFVDALQAARPGVEIDLMPTASTLAALIHTEAFADLAATLLPEAPEDGAVARAMLSGAVGFAAGFDTPLPASSTVFGTADPALKAAYPTLAKAINTAVLGDQPVEIDPDPVVVTGTDGDDTLVLTPALEKADLGAGFDSVAIGTTRDATNIVFGADGTVFVQMQGDTSPAALSDVERMEFTDGTLALDTDGIAGQAYRLYQAAFDRIPDAEGLGYWIDELDADRVTLNDAARFFMQSDEFAAAYGAPDEVTDVLFLTLLYVNALDRTPDEDGFIFWRDQQDKGLTRAEMMVYFSESEENTAQVAPAIADGIWYF